MPHDELNVDHVLEYLLCAKTYIDPTLSKTFRYEFSNDIFYENFKKLLRNIDSLSIEKVDFAFEGLDLFDETQRSNDFSHYLLAMLREVPCFPFDNPHLGKEHARFKRLIKKSIESCPVSESSSSESETLQVGKEHDAYLDSFKAFDYSSLEEKFRRMMLSFLDNGLLKHAYITHELICLCKKVVENIESKEGFEDKGSFPDGMILSGILRGWLQLDFTNSSVKDYKRTLKFFQFFSGHLIRLPIFDNSFDFYSDDIEDKLRQCYTEPEKIIKKRSRSFSKPQLYLPLHLLRNRSSESSSSPKSARGVCPTYRKSNVRIQLILRNLLEAKRSLNEGQSLDVIRELKWSEARDLIVGHQRLSILSVIKRYHEVIQPDSTWISYLSHFLHGNLCLQLGEPKINKIIMDFRNCFVLRSIILSDMGSSSNSAGNSENADDVPVNEFLKLMLSYIQASTPENCLIDYVYITHEFFCMLRLTEKENAKDPEFYEKLGETFFNWLWLDFDIKETLTSREMLNNLKSCMRSLSKELIHHPIFETSINYGDTTAQALRLHYQVHLLKPKLFDPMNRLAVNLSQCTIGAGSTEAISYQEPRGPRKWKKIRDGYVSDSDLKTSRMRKRDPNGIPLGLPAKSQTPRGEKKLIKHPLKRSSSSPRI